MFTLSNLFNKPDLPTKPKTIENKIKIEEATTTLKKAEIEEVKDIYDLIIELMKETNPDIEKKMLDQYDSHLKNINLDLTMKIKTGLPNHIITTHLNHAKYNLFEICMKKFLEYLSNVDGRLLNILGSINDAHNLIVKNLISFQKIFKCK